MSHDLGPTKDFFSRCVRDLRCCCISTSEQKEATQSIVILIIQVPIKYDEVVPMYEVTLNKTCKQDIFPGASLETKQTVSLSNR